MIKKSVNKPEREGYRVKPSYQGKLDDVIVVQTSEWAFTNFKRKRPIIGTPGFQRCLVVLGYEPSRHECFLVHLKGTSDEQQSLADLEKELHSGNNYQLGIYGGESDSQRERAEELIELFGGSQLINGYFIERDLFGLSSNNLIRSIAIDSRDGRLYTFIGMVPLRADNWIHPMDYWDNPQDTRIKDYVKRVK